MLTMVMMTMTILTMMTMIVVVTMSWQKAHPDLNHGWAHFAYVQRDRCKADITLRSSRAVYSPPQYYPGPVPLNFGGRERSGAFGTVWPSANMLMMMSCALERDGPWHSITEQMLKLCQFICAMHQAYA
jgi:hypothetical protein